VSFFVVVGDAVEQNVKEKNNNLKFIDCKKSEQKGVHGVYDGEKKSKTVKY
jgi:hypothetical protein